MLREMPERRLDDPEPFGEPADTEESWAAYETFLARAGFDPLVAVAVDDPARWRDGEASTLNTEPDSRTLVECTAEAAE